MILIGISLYLYVANLQNISNHNFNKYDQLAYSDFVRNVYESNFTYSGQRNRMPLYPYTQALFYSPNMDDETLFQHGKQVNIVLSLFCIAVLGGVFFMKFTKIFAFYSITIIALLVFVFKAPYFQSEIVFYTLFGLAFIVSINTLRYPKWYKSILVGILFGLAYLTKATVLIAIVMLISGFVVLTFTRQLTQVTDKKTLLKDLLVNILLPPLVFLIIVFPYANESKEIYGTYFYNVNTTFYIWYDSWDEATNGTKKAGDRVGWPVMAEDEIPSLSKYLNEHSTNEIIKRFTKGLGKLQYSMCEHQGFAYGYCLPISAFIIFTFVSLITSYRIHRMPQIYGNLHIIWFCSIFFIGYTLAFAWYMPIISSVSNGTRTIIALLIPILWTIGILLHRPQIQLWHITIHHHTFKIINIFYKLMFFLILYELYHIVIFRAGLMDGGN
jgi:hypothetical protein